MSRFRLWLIAFVTVIPLVGFTQVANLDSLRAAADSLHALGDSLLAWAEIEFEEQLAKAVPLDTAKNSREKRYSEASVSFNEEIELRMQLADTIGWCAALNQASEAYRRNKNYDHGMKLAQRALELGILVFGEEDTSIATSYHNIGAIYSSSNDFDLALDNQKKALEIRLKILGPEHLEVASSYIAIGETYRRYDQLKKALECYEKALEIFNNQSQTLGRDKFRRYLNLYISIGDAYRGLGDYERAIKSYQKPLELAQGIYGERSRHVGDSYLHLGLCYWGLGMYQEALDAFSEARDIWVELFGINWHGVAAVDNYLANLHARLGDYNSTLKFHKEALASRIAVFGEGHPKTGQIHRNLAVDYYVLDDLEQAKKNAREALDIWSKSLTEGEPFDEADYSIYASVISESASDSVVEEELRKALERTIAAVPYWENTYGENNCIVAGHYGDLGDLYFSLEEFKSAQRNYEKSQAIWAKIRGAGHPIVGSYHIDIGTALEKRGKHRKALENYRAALDIYLKSLGPKHMGVASCYYRIGKVYRSMNKKDSAMVYFSKAIEIFEETRGQLDSPGLQTSYTKRLAALYESIISLLIEMDRPKEAFEYLERSKLKSLKDALEERYDIDFGKGTMRKKIEESKRLGMKEDALKSQLLEEQQKPDSLRNRLKVENLSELLAETKAEYFRVAAEIQADPDYAFAVRVQPTDIGVLRNELPEGQRLLMTYAGENELYLFLVSREGYEVRSVPVSRDSLYSLISRCRSLCGVGNAKRLDNEDKLFGWSWEDDGSEFYRQEVAPLKDVLSKLYTCLIEPLEEELSSTEVVTFIPSGQLYYIPWGALLDAEGDSLVFLSEKYNWNILTSTELLRCIQRSKHKHRRLRFLALVGNPAGIHPPLPSTEEEVTSIESVYPNSTILTGFDATEPQVIRVTPQNQVLHLATHCKLDRDSPWDSYISLAQTDSTDGHWTMSEISGQSWDKMQLVTLSACETALGGDRPGLEFQSMAKAFSIAMEGPPSIIATLWPVADESTKELMVTFYEDLKDNPKSEALRLAQQKLIHSDKYAHPFFWAPFILIGEWR